MTECLKPLTTNRDHVARFFGAALILTVGLFSACSAQAPEGNQSVAGTPETTPTTPSETTTPTISFNRITPETGDETATRDLDIELLYLDLSVCGPCQGTEATLDEAVSEVRPILESTGFRVNVTKTHVESEAQAQSLGFISSPTIRINGRDMQARVEEGQCPSCSDLCGDDVDCRIWVYEGKEYWAPPKPMIITAIMAEAYSGAAEQTPVAAPSGTELPDNLKRFFAAKGEQDETGGSCCPPSGACCPG